MQRVTKLRNGCRKGTCREEERHTEVKKIGDREGDISQDDIDRQINRQTDR